MEEKKKKTHFAIEKTHFFLLIFFWPVLWLCIYNMNCIACEGVSITFQITQNGEELRKICQSVRS